MKKIFYIIMFVFIITANVFASSRSGAYYGSRAYYNTSQDYILSLISPSIRVDNIGIYNGQNMAHIYCIPKIFLTAGNCFIDYNVITNGAIDKSTAYTMAAQKYNLTMHADVYDVVFSDDNETITIICEYSATTKKSDKVVYRFFLINNQNNLQYVFDRYIGHDEVENVIKEYVSQGYSVVKYGSLN